MTRPPAATAEDAEDRVRNDLARRHTDLDDRAIRALASENDHGPWVERNRKGGRRDAIRWRVRLADVAARRDDRLTRWGVR